MRLVKLRCLGLMAIGIFAASLGVAASASGNVVATVLCEENVKLCPKAKIYTGVLQFLGSEHTILGSLSVQCKNTLSGKTGAEEKTALRISIETLTWSNCTGCTTASAIGLPYNAELKVTSGGNGTLTTPITEKLTGCPFGITCTYSAAAVTFEFTGGSEPTLTTKEASLKGEGFGCGSTAKLDNKVILCPPKALFASPEREA